MCEGSCTPLGDHYSAGNCRETWDWPAHWDSNSDSQSHQAPQLQSGFVLVHVGTSVWVSTRQSSHKVLVWNGLNMLSPDSRWQLLQQLLGRWLTMRFIRFPFFSNQGKFQKALRGCMLHFPSLGTPMLPIFSSISYISHVEDLIF